MRHSGLLLLLFACSSTTPPDPPPQNDGGVMVGEDAGTPPEGPTFRCEVIAGLNSAALVGDNAAIALMDNGLPAVAYGFVAQGSIDREIHYAEYDGADWTTEQVVFPGANAPGGGELTGLGLAFVGGIPHIVYQGGDDDGVATTPFPTDLMLSTKNGGAWTERTLVDTSAEAPATCDGVQNYCNVGGVVGTHAAIAAGPSNSFAVVYRDTHFGFARDDFARSDVEVYSEGGPFNISNADPVRSGGTYADVAFLPDGNVVIAYNLEEPDPAEDRTGVWAAFYDGAGWQLRHVSMSQTSAKVSLAVAPSGTIYLALYAVDSSDLIVANSIDGGDTWTSEMVDTTGRTGLHPHISIDGEGRPVVAYGYCGRQSDTNCPAQLGPRSEVRMARLEGGSWQVYKVDDGQGNGSVGLFNRVITLPDGKLGVAFQDARNNDLLFAKEQ